MCNCNATDQHDFSWHMSSSFLKWVCHFVESTLESSLLGFEGEYHSKLGENCRLY